MAESNSDELLRLEELKSYCILDTSSESDFDDITRLIAEICDTPIATVTLIDETREWFKSAYGTDTRENKREIAFCARAIASRDIYIVSDTLKHPDYMDNPMVQGAPFIRFYAGVPLISPNGYALGTLAIKDTVPRELTQLQLETLKTFSKQVMVQLELRRQRLSLEKEREFLSALLENLSDGIVACDANGELSLFNHVTRELHGLTDVKIGPEEWAEHYDLYMADGKSHMSKEMIPLFRAFNGEHIQNETLVIAPKNQSPKLVMCSGQPIFNANGEKLGAVVAMKDVTEQQAKESALAKNEAKLAAIFNQSNMFQGLVKIDGTVIDINDLALSACGYQREQEIGKKFWECSWWNQDPAIAARIKRIVREGKAGKVIRAASDYHVASGERRQTEFILTPIRDQQNEVEYLLISGLDVTQQRQAETELARVNRALRMLSSCNELLIRAQNESDLLNQLCQLVVEVGGYKMSWVGYAEQDEYCSIKPIAHFGDFSHLENIRLSWSEDIPEGKGPAGITVRSGKPIVIEDLLNLPSFAPWAESAKKNQFYGVVCLPLRHSGLVFGLLAMYADEVRHVTDDETKLLQELADDLAFGIINIRNSERIQYLAFYDPLTTLPNRTLFVERLTAVLASPRTDNYSALIFIDIDNFKALNDTLGHDKGDMLLQQIAQRLKGCVSELDTVARLGGDEFVLLIPYLGADKTIAKNKGQDLGEKLLAVLDQPYELGSHMHQSTPSIGIALFSEDADNTSELMKRADLAMYEAKAAGKNTFRFFDPKMQAEISERVSLEKDLRACLVKHQLSLHYQPQIDINNQVIGAEALLRWHHPARGHVSPALFIPLAEETGVILQIGNWILKTACTQLASWALNPKTSDLALAVNVSVSQFRQPDFVSIVLNMLDHFGVDPSRLKLELTESVFAENTEDIIHKMYQLREKGIGFSLDDFGTGYSSLTYLKKMPLDQLKIDQSFVRDILVDPNDAAIAYTIINLAQSLGLEVIAEGVETEEQKEVLFENGCYLYQGYLFSKPLPINEFNRYLE